MGTSFSDVYNRFLGRITDDMYIELTPEDTIRDLRNILVSVLPEFEFPRVDLFDYKIEQEIVDQDKILSTDFIIGTVWEDINNTIGESPRCVVERSAFKAELSSEEILILSILMQGAWVQRQVTSIENTRMKYSGTDFKLTSQANHLQKLLTLQTECRRQSHHYQRLYGRRKKGADGRYKSTWSMFNTTRTEDNGSRPDDDDEVIIIQGSVWNEIGSAK